MWGLGTAGCLRPSPVGTRGLGWRTWPSLGVFFWQQLPPLSVCFELHALLQEVVQRCGLTVGQTGSHIVRWGDGSPTTKQPSGSCIARRFQTLASAPLLGDDGKPFGVQEPHLGSLSSPLPLPSSRPALLRGCADTEHTGAPAGSARARSEIAGCLIMMINWERGACE